MATEQNSKTEQEGRDAEREGGSKVPIMVGSSEEEERRVGVVREERKEWDQIFIQCLYKKDNLQIKPTQKLASEMVGVE